MTESQKRAKVFNSIRQLLFVAYKKGYFDSKNGNTDFYYQKEDFYGKFARIEFMVDELLVVDKFESTENTTDDEIMELCKKLSIIIMSEFNF